MLTQKEQKALDVIRKRWAPKPVTQPMNLDAWAKGDIDTLITLVDKLHADAMEYERHIDDTYRD